MDIALSLQKEITRIEELMMDIWISVTGLKEKDEKDKLAKRYSHKKQIYYDLIDRLCMAIKNKYIEGKVWEQEYKPIIKSIIKLKGEKEVQKKYRNIYEMSKKWGLDGD